MTDHSFKLRNGRQLGYAECGDPSGAVLFYHHGWPSGRRQGELMDRLGRAYGLRIVAPDRPGIGLSDHQPQRRLLDWPETLADLAVHVGAGRFHLLGWSGGGPYVLAACAAMPERVLSSTVVCGAPPLAELGDARLFWIYRLLIRLRRYLPVLLGPVLALGARVAEVAEPDRPPLSWLLCLLRSADRRVLADPEVFRIVRAAMLDSLKRGATAVTTDAEAYLQPWGFDPAAIELPVHFWHGRDDRNIDWTYSRDLAQRLPRARSHWLDDEGHYSLPIVHNEAILRAALGLD
jgi:pimeloyl-ACP methyl ester carboxylesterase